MVKEVRDCLVPLRGLADEKYRHFKISIVSITVLLPESLDMFSIFIQVLILSLFKVYTTFDLFHVTCFTIFLVFDYLALIHL